MIIKNRTTYFEAQLNEKKMKLKIEFIDEDTGQKIVVKNRDTTVVYQNSEVHDSGEFEELTGKVYKFNPNEREIVNTFYKLASNLI